jgi:isoleucyl-tRNA synthetase
VTVRPNFKTLGKRCGPKLKEVGAALAGWSAAEVSRLEAGESLSVVGEPIALADVILQRAAKDGAAVASDGHITVALDTRLDDALRREGIAREFTSLLQNARKDAGLEVTDRINVAWTCTDSDTAAALREHGPAIAKETLAITFGEGNGTATLDVNGVPVAVSLSKD